MSPYVYLFSLLTALAWGSGHIFNKRGLAIGGTPLQSSLTIVTVNFSLFWLLFLAMHRGDFFVHLSLRTATIFTVSGLFGSALGRLISLSGIHHVGATVNSAAINTRPLFATAIAVIFLGETASPLLFVGIFFVVAGVVILVFSKGGDRRGWHAWQLWIPLSAAAAFAIGNVIRRFGLTSTPLTVEEALVIDQTAGFIGLAAYALARKRRDVLSAPPRTYLFYASAGVLTTIAHLSLFKALDHGPVAIVDPLVATQPLFTTFLAYFLLGDLERITLKLIIGTIVIIVGAAIIMACGAIPVTG
jgi:drug/metabolite transporter, DME family